jgi:hypothetical protein
MASRTGWRRTIIVASAIYAAIGLVTVFYAYTQNAPYSQNTSLEGRSFAEAMRAQAALEVHNWAKEEKDRKDTQERIARYSRELGIKLDEDPEYKAKLVAEQQRMADLAQLYDMNPTATFGQPGYDPRPLPPIEKPHMVVYYAHTVRAVILTVVGFLGGYALAVLAARTFIWVRSGFSADDT